MSARDTLYHHLHGTTDTRDRQLDAFRAEVLIEAADALPVWPGDQTPEEERPGYDGPTIDAADRLDDALRPMPREDRARLISEHRGMVVGELVAELRRMAAAGQAPAPQPRRLDDDGRCRHCRRTPERCDATGCGGRRDPAPRPETDDGLARVCPWWKCYLTEPHPAHLGCTGIEQPPAPQPETAPDAGPLALPWAHRMSDSDLHDFLGDLVSAAINRWQWDPEVPDRETLAAIEKACADWRTPGRGSRSDEPKDAAPDFYQSGHTYSNEYGWKFRVDTVTVHPEDGERTALGWRFWNGSWEPYAYGEGDWDIGQFHGGIDVTASSEASGAES